MRERIKRIAGQIGTQVPAELLQANEVWPSDPVAGNRLRGAVRARAALRRERPLGRPRSGLAAACAAAVLVALVVLIGLTGAPSETPTDDKHGSFPNGSGGADQDAGVAEILRVPREGEPLVPTGEGRRPTGTGAFVVAVTPWTTPTLTSDKDCSDFKSQKRAQRWFNQHHPRRDPSGLDRDHDGKACEGKPCPCSHFRPRRDRSGSTRHAVADRRAPRDVAALTVPSGSTATWTTGMGSGAVPPTPTPAPGPAPGPANPITPTVRNVDQAVTGAGVQGGLSRAAGALTSGLGPAVGGLGRTVGGAGHTVTGATGGLLGN